MAGRAEELRKTQLQSLPTSSVIAVSCIALVHPLTVHGAPFLWLVAILSVNLTRYAYTRQYQAGPKTAELAEVFLHKVFVFNIIVGLLWAMIPALFLDIGKVEAGMPLIIVACICAGAAVQSASYAPAALAIIVPIMTVILIKFLAMGSTGGYIMAFDGALYFGFLVGIALRVQASVLKMIRSGSDATSLAASLEKEHAATQAAAARLYVLANLDSLTGLANRAALSTHLASWLDTARQEDHSFFFVLLDLDHFKSINDTLGHAAGDEVLKEVAARLSATVPQGSIVARLGGDEFALLVAKPCGARPEALVEDDLARVAQTIMVGVCGPFTVAESLVNIKVSIGLATYPGNGLSAEALFTNTDLALYAAKDGGRQRWRSFDASMLAAVKMTRDIEHDLLEALRGGALEVWYQPQIALRSGELAGLEALLRWNHPVHGWIAPPMIVMAAIQIHASHELAAFVLDHACRTIQEMSAPRWSNVLVAVNISPREFERYDLADLVKTILAKHGVDPGRLELEITEEAFAASDNALAILDKLSAMGMRLAIDDFGTGFASLGYLRSMRVHRLKIDRMFVTGLADHAGDRILVQAILGIGRSFGIDVVAEGVETAEEAALLLAYGCHVVQGFYYGRPMSEQTLREWTQARFRRELIPTNPAGATEAPEAEAFGMRIHA